MIRVKYQNDPFNNNNNNNNNNNKLLMNTFLNN